MNKKTEVELEKARATLKYTNRQLRKINSIPIDVRGSLDNENFVKLGLQKKHLNQAIEQIKTKLKKNQKRKGSLR